MKQVAILFFTVVALFACSKDSGNDNTAITKENIAGSYKLTSIKVQPNNTEVIDQLDACQQDDIFQLNTDNSVSYIDAGVKCTPPGDGTGTWSLSGNTLTLSGEMVTIKSFDGTHLIVEGQQEVQGFQVNATITFTKQ